MCICTSTFVTLYLYALIYIAFYILQPLRLSEHVSLLITIIAIIIIIIAIIHNIKLKISKIKHSFAYINKIKACLHLPSVKLVASG